MFSWSFQGMYFSGFTLNLSWCCCSTVKYSNTFTPAFDPNESKRSIYNDFIVDWGVSAAINFFFLPDNVQQP